ncbi:coatomer subunit delta [Nematocida homosporus]|uniref:coatomer subunit delta n=1 Tax=Nematocida homosporus TaxID=1912981 RepID=UPI0022204893|nr:coatomer subunit delta [Nematocida homosporus]KAI5186535.1 coatomer subunit delta [Nematocida homosporus]
MLAAVLLASPHGPYIARALTNLSKTKSLKIVETFLEHKARTKEPKGQISTDIGHFFYQDIDNLYLAVLADESETKVFKGLQLLEGVIKTATPNLSMDSYGPEVSGLLSVIDEIFTPTGVVDRSPEDLNKTYTMQSNDEVLHQMIQKTQEKEREKALKMHQRHPSQSALDEISKELQEIKILKEDLKSSKSQQETVSIPNQKTQPTYSSSSPTSKSQLIKSQIKSKISNLTYPINLITQIKLNTIFNAVTEQSKTEGSGELHLKITNDSYAAIHLSLQHKPNSTRAHPSVDKKAFNQNKIIPREDLPTNHLLTLLKWTEDQPQLPFEVSFWQTEISEERYRFFIEIIPSLSIESLSIQVPIRRLSDIETSNGTIQEDFLTTQATNLPAEDSFSLEFTGLCDNTDSLFPFKISYTIDTPNTLHSLQIPTITTSDSPNDPIPTTEIHQHTFIEGECTVLQSDPPNYTH